jgi:hypothetical protein
MAVTLEELFGVQDSRKRTLLQELGLLRVLALPSASLQLSELLACSRVHCISKVGSTMS